MKYYIGTLTVLGVQVETGPRKDSSALEIKRNTSAALCMLEGGCRFFLKCHQRPQKTGVDTEDRKLVMGK